MQDINKRRDRHEIVAEILAAAKRGAIKTHIMYKVKLSYAQVNEYLPLLVEKGFLEDTETSENNQTRHVLKTSKQGEQFLRNFRTLELLQ